MLVEYWLQTQRCLHLRPQTAVPQVGQLVVDQAPDGTVRAWYTVVAVEWPIDFSAPQDYYSLTDEAQVVVRVRLVPAEEVPRE